MPTTDLTDQIATAAASPASAAVDNQSASAHSLPDTILADQYLAAKERIDGVSNAQGGPRSAWAALRPARAIPRGAV